MTPEQIEALRQSKVGGTNTIPLTVTKYTSSIDDEVFDGLQTLSTKKLGTPVNQTVKTNKLRTMLK